MFYSTGNNFGAGQIRFKSYQAENYLVLNANFTIDTSSLAYQGATVLEIYVPALRIDRSVEVGVFVGIRDSLMGRGATMTGARWREAGSRIPIQSVLRSWAALLDIASYTCTLQPYTRN